MSNGGTTIDVMQFLGVFREESAEHILTLEGSLLELEKTPRDSELLNRLFRAAHSIKGGASTFGMTEVAGFTHHMESLLDAMRDDKVVATSALVDLLLRSTDAVRMLLAASAGEGSPPCLTPLVDALSAALGEQDSLVHSTSAGHTESQAFEALKTVARHVKVEFQPSRDIFREGLDPILLLREVRDLGEVVESAVQTEKLPTLGGLNPDSSYLGYMLTIRTDKDVQSVRDVFDFVAEPSGVIVSEVSLSPPISDGQTNAGVDDVVPRAATSSQESANDQSSRTSTVEQTRSERNRGAEQSNSIRVSIEKIDRLMNLVGELVINQSMVAQALRGANAGKMTNLVEAVAEMERNTRELQERVMSVRMVPVSAVFGRVPRIVRDLASQLNKQIEVELEGEDTELDKIVVEKIADPLIHLIRNAVDHGIELPATREAAGKSPHGTVRLLAYHQGGSVVLEISDDGKGLDVAKIRGKALSQGLISPDAELSDEQIQQLIFEPGFSTADEVSSVSGRGVGMDVVRRNIEALNGSVSIQSVPGKGARFRIALPLTLAILDGLCVRVADATYILQLTTIIESLKLKPGQCRKMLGHGEVILVRDETIPLIRLHRVFDISESVIDPYEGIVIVVEHQGRRVCLLADEITGQSQVVIKSLETHFRRVEGLMGATILGDGHVALILDIQGLIGSHLTSEKTRLSVLEGIRA